MFDTYRIASDFSQAAAQYDNHADLQRQVLKKLIAGLHIPADAIILDAGCGTGMLQTLLSDKKVISLDIAYAMCAKAGAKNRCAVNASVEHLPIRDNSMDVVVSSLVLQWVQGWQASIGEMLRVLKPGGVLAISSFGDGTLKELQASFAAVDSYPHISEFLPHAAFARCDSVIEYVPNVKTLMRHLKSIGARNKMAGRGRSLMTPRQLARVQDYYHAHFATLQGLRVTWEILTSIIAKP